jgi:ParB family chromosome partitioning protein
MEEAKNNGQEQSDMGNIAHDLPDESQEAEETAPPPLVGYSAPEIAVPVPHVAHNAGEQEWYTPAVYVEAARRVLGEIDLDPASSEIAQRTVQAATFYTKEDNGLAQQWEGTVWMNPPYASGLVDEFIAKLCGHVETGEVTAAIILVNNATETRWFHQAMAAASAMCFPKGRIRFLDTKGNPSGAPLQGQAFLYFGPDASAFSRVFEEFGRLAGLIS